MTIEKYCSEFDICEELPPIQKTVCYQQVSVESIRHHIVMDHLGEGFLITVISLIGIFLAILIYAFMREIHE